VNRVVYASEVPADSPPMFTVVVPEDKDRRARAITTLLEGRDGTIWVGTFKGLYRLESTSKGFTLRSVEIGMPGGISGDRYVTDMLEDRYGLLWIAAASGLYRRWPDGTAARYTTSDGLPDNNLHDLLEDHRGQLWAGTRLGGFFRFTVDETHTPPIVAGVYELDGLAKWVTSNASVPW
jgi:ligand-binding sensor domain-containing protein